MPPDSIDSPVEGFLPVAGGHIHYLVWNEPGAAQIHFLHANGFCSATYAPMIESLTPRFRVLASDIRWHGDSVQTRMEKIRHWSIFADDLRQVVQRVMSPPVIGIGHSLGAVATCIAASKNPGLFSALVLIDPVFLPFRLLAATALLKVFGLSGRLPLARGARRRKKEFRGKEEALRRFTAGRGIFKTWSREFIDAYLECGLLVKDADTAVLKCDPEIEAQIFESVPLDVWRYTQGLRCPVLCIRGEHSDTFLPDAAARFQRKVPQSRLVTVAGAGHFIPMEKPDACADAILRFVDGI